MLRVEYLKPIAFIVVVFAAMLYIYGLDKYLSSLVNPTPMKFILLSSFVIALLFEVSNGWSDKAATDIAVTALIFASAVFLAIEVREVYLNIIAELNSAKDREGTTISDLIGHDYTSALNNKVVGVAACVAGSVALLRLSLRKMIATLFQSFFIINKQEICAHCGR